MLMPTRGRDCRARDSSDEIYSAGGSFWPGGLTLVMDASTASAEVTANTGKWRSLAEKRVVESVD